MTTDRTRETGWKPIPLPLKILAVLMAFWSAGSVANLPNLMEGGLPLFGNFVFGTSALLVVLALDIVGPLVFLFALWTRKSWGPKWAMSYIGLFILNGLVAFFTVQAQLGLAQILVPNVVSFLFLSVIYWKRAYFDA